MTDRMSFRAKYRPRPFWGAICMTHWFSAGVTKPATKNDTKYSANTNRSRLFRAVNKKGANTVNPTENRKIKHMLTIESLR